MKEPEEQNLIIDVDGTRYIRMDTFKSNCDHCGVVVDAEWWTFNLNQCVVCDAPECKAKQRKILHKAMDDAVESVFQKMIGESD